MVIKCDRDTPSWTIYPGVWTERDIIELMMRPGWLEKAIREAAEREVRPYYVMLRLRADDAAWLREKGANRTIRRLVLEDDGASVWAGREKLERGGCKASVRVEIRDRQVINILQGVKSRQAYCSELIRRERMREEEDDII